MSASPLFDEVVRASRLNRLIAPFTISRLLTRADVLPAELTREHIARALPELENGLSVYLGPDELRAALTDIKALASAHG